MARLCCANKCQVMVSRRLRMFTLDAHSPRVANEMHTMMLLQCCVVVAESPFVWLVADGWCWFVLRGKYCRLIAGGWFVLREKYCWPVADKPSEQGVDRRLHPAGLVDRGGIRDHHRT
jgi:hypothetical protein